VVSAKWERREKKLRRRRYGMRVVGLSTRTVLARLVRKPKR